MFGGLGLGLGLGFRVGVRVRVSVRVNYFRDSFSVLLRAQHYSMLTTFGSVSTTRPTISPHASFLRYIFYPVGPESQIEGEFCRRIRESVVGAISAKLF